MPEYTMDLDGLPTTGNGQTDLGGIPGPYLRWHAQPTLDGAFDAGTWSLRDRDGTTAIQLAEVVFDWPSSRTGWMLSQPGQPPERRWNASRTKFMPRPDKTGAWRRAVQVELAYDTDARCLWEQAGESAWLTYCEIMLMIRDTAMQALPRLPLITHAGHKEIPMSRGSALVAQWKLLRYVPRPLCLPEDTAPPAATTDKSTGASADRWVASPPPAATRGDLDDEIPF
jgi:hypothetical protein